MGILANRPPPGPLVPAPQEVYVAVRDTDAALSGAVRAPQMAIQAPGWTLYRYVLVPWKKDE